MEPTEGELTVAVDAAARVVYTQGREDFTPKFDELPPLEANQYREAVLSIVWAALHALPDRAATARAEAAALIDAEVAAEEKRLRERDPGRDPYSEPMLSNWLGGIKVGAEVLRREST